MRFIQVGVGGFGACWVDVLTRSRQARLVALVDVSKKALAAARAASGCRADACFGTLGEALRKIEADAAVIVTPPELHRKGVVEALAKGLDVISEKPMADSMAGCRAMLRAASETGRTYVVSQNYRYSPEMWTLARMVRGGRLGKVGQVKVDFFRGVDFGGGFRHSMAYPLIVDMSIHHFDLVRFVTGLDPLSVRAASWNPPWSNYRGDGSSTALFEMHNGARVLYSGSWCSKGQYCDWNGNWQVECEKGTVTYNAGEITVYDVPGTYGVRKTSKVKLVKPPRTGQNFVLHDFMNAVKTGKPARTAVTDNIHSIAMVFATVKAMQSGKVVPVLDAGTRRLL